MHNRLLNFIVTGDVRSGSAVVQSVINNLNDAVCHADLLHPDEPRRRSSHTAYFGPALNPEVPSWYHPTISSAHQYLSRSVFDVALHGENAVGVRLPYSQLSQLDLYDLLEERCRDGDFCLIHVVRNPLACYVSQVQAERSGQWVRSINDKKAAMDIPAPVFLDHKAVTKFVRQHHDTRLRVQRACDDTLELPYSALHYDFNATMRRVLEFLEVPSFKRPLATIARLRNHELADRIVNFKEVAAAVPPDVRKHFTDDEDLV